MALRYVNWFHAVCYLVLFVVLSAVADISMDYYFGNEKPLRSAGHILIEDCGTAAMRYHCYQKCGTNHACLLGQCFCVKARASESEEVSDKDRTEEQSSAEEHAGSKVVYEDEEDYQEPISDKDRTEEQSSAEEHAGSKVVYEDEEDYQEPILQSAYDDKSNNLNEELVDQPEALRHHIAHFCPNLNKAQKCIRKCMKLGLPAFCGKDHVCYCGHNYPYLNKKPKVDPKMIRNQFKDLYEKYFGKNKN